MFSRTGLLKRLQLEFNQNLVVSPRNLPTLFNFLGFFPSFPRLFVCSNRNQSSGARSSGCFHKINVAKTGTQPSKNSSKIYPPQPGSRQCIPCSVSVPCRAVDPICMAPVAKTGKRCTHKRQGESRWCGNHFNAWHGQEDPDL